MANAKVRSFLKLSKNNARSVLMRAWRRRGYQDAMAGRGFCREYETATRSEQWAYENGRLCFNNIKSAGIKTPHWRSNVFDCPYVKEASLMARNIVGDYEVRNGSHG